MRKSLPDNGPLAVAGLLLAVASALSCGGKSKDAKSGWPEGNATAGSVGIVGAEESTGGSNVASGSGGAPQLSGGSTSTTAATTSAAGLGNVPDRMAQLNAQSSWRELKTLWRRLDDVEPNGATSYAYASTITTEQRDQWIAELSAQLGAIQTTGLLSDLELLFLREIATARIEVMRDGGYHYEMFLHRAPELFEGATETSIERLEQKLDTLEALRANCRLEADAYRQALEQVEREATVFFVMEQLMQEPLSYAAKLELPADLWGLELTTELDRRLATLEADQTLSAATTVEISTLRTHLKSIESTVAELPAFLRELERCE